MRRVVIKWVKDSVLKKIEKVRFVVQKMTENAGTFPSPEPPLADMSGQANKLEAAETAASEGGKDRTQQRDIELAIMEEMMDNQILYVQTVTKGDKDLTELAGMETKSDGTRWPLPFKPEGFEAKPGKLAGSIYMRCNGTQYKKQYNFQMQEVDADGVVTWRTIKVQGSNRHTIENLERGKLYTFRVFASNTKGDGPASNEATCPAA